MNPNTAPRPATAAQLDYLRSLLTARQVPPAQRTVIQAALDNGDMNAPTASVCITALRALPPQPRNAPAPQPVTEPGMYRRPDGTIARVQRSRQSPDGRRRLYAKLLVTYTDPDGSQRAAYEYNPGLINRLSPADRMTPEQAQAYGRETGSCCVCARTLTNPDSIAAGIGPICSGRL